MHLCLPLLVTPLLVTGLGRLIDKDQILMMSYVLPKGAHGTSIPCVVPYILLIIRVRGRNLPCRPVLDLGSHGVPMQVGILEASCMLRSQLLFSQISRFLHCVLLEELSSAFHSGCNFELL